MSPLPHAKLPCTPGPDPGLPVPGVINRVLFGPWSFLN